MYRTCLYCHGDLGANEEIEQLPIGRRLAFDPAKGRLWVVCRGCERWNLTPFEERWEAIETCEERFRGTKLRYSTEHIGLARLPDGLGLVRIGEPLRPEMAAWRYGDQFGRRRRRDILLTGAVTVGAASAYLAVIAVAKFAFLGGGLFKMARSVRRRLWARGRLVDVAGPEGSTVRLSPDQIASVQLWKHQVGGHWLLAIPNSPMGASSAVGRSQFRVLSGPDAVVAARRILPIINHAGGNRVAVTRAVERIESQPDVDHWLNEAAAHPRPGLFGGNGEFLARQPVDLRLAAEMLLHEEFERRSLAGEIWLLEREWQRAEEIAAIADNLLLPDGVEERIDAMREP